MKIKPEPEEFWTRSSTSKHGFVQFATFFCSTKKWKSFFMKYFQRTHSTLFFFVSDYLPCWTLWTSVFQNDIHDSFTCRFKLNHWSRWSAWKTLLSGHMILNVPAFSFFLWVWLEMEARGHVFWKNEYTVWANVSPSSPYDLQFPWTNVYIAFLNKQIEIPRTTIWP